MKMNFLKNNSTILIVLVILSVAFLSNHGVEATRVLQEDFAHANHLQTHYPPSVYQTAKNTMACWLQILASGPSPRGSGH
ncbi:unnamed protein product [Prunus armeniaca]|uniref:Transmembrane protein n=1 Tax=Prunus armeniaca TaxID=36596 RepID=A0A6J5TIL8_PRUAR|nr:unnamed protein product [Prunus armeniaca]